MSGEPAGEALSLTDHSIERHSKSFSLASKLLPAPHRHPARVIYAWCRRADDRVDHCEQQDAPARVTELRRELSELYAGRAGAEAVLQGFARVTHEFGIPQLYPAELLAGMEMDASGQRYETLEDLLHYCYRVASTVGLMMCHVMGVRDESALRHAAHLGLAMQLTNICRDVAEDFERGRLYLPAEVLHQHGLMELEPGQGALRPKHEAGLCRAVETLLDLADRYYASGDAGLVYLSPRCRLAIDAARRIYSAIGTVLRRRGCRVLAPRAFVPLRKKLLLLGGAAAATAAFFVCRPGRFSPAALDPIPYGPSLITL